MDLFGFIGNKFLQIIQTIKKHPFKSLILLIFIILSIVLKFSEANIALNDEFVGSDPEAYHRNAQTFLNGEGPISSWHNPLQTIYLVIVYAVFGVDLYAARVIQIILSFIIPFFLYKFTSKHFGEGPGFIAALFALVEQNIVYYTAHLWDMFWVIFFLSWLLYLYSNHKDDKTPNIWIYFLMGILSAIGALGKIWVLAAGIVLVAFMFIANNKWKFSWGLVSKNFVSGLLFLAGLAVILVPWMIHASAGAGFFVFINQNSALNYYLGNNPDEEVAMTSRYDWSYAYDAVIPEGNCGEIIQNESYPKYNKYFIQCLQAYTDDYIFHNPGKFIKKMWRFTFEFWLFPNLEWFQRTITNPGYWMFMQWFFFIFSWLGFLFSLQKFREMLPYYLIVLGIWLSYAITVYLARYKSSHVPISILFAALGFYSLYYFVAKQFKKNQESKKE